MIKDEFHLKGMTSHRWSQGISKYYLLLALLLKEYLRISHLFIPQSSFGNQNQKVTYTMKGTSLKYFKAPGLVCYEPVV